MSNASERVHAYLDELSTRKTLDPEIIQSLRPEVLGEISLRVSDLHAILAALEAVEALAEQWRYKGEFGWGAWQEGHGPDPEGHVLDSAASDIRKAIKEALR